MYTNNNDLDLTYGVVFTTEEQHRIVKLFIAAHNQLGYVLRNLASPNAQSIAFGAAVLAMSNVMEAKSYFAKEWDETLHGEVVGYRRSHLATVATRSFLLSIVNSSASWSFYLNQAHMELWAGAMNFAEAAPALDPDKVLTELDKII